MFSRASRLLFASAGFLAPLLFSGCPASSKSGTPPRLAQIEDVVGAWRYPEIADESGNSDWVITIEFAKDGSFQQTLVPPRGSSLIQQAGSWQLEGSHVRLRQLVVWDENVAGHFARRDQTWAMIDSAKSRGTSALVGGLDADHTSDREFERLTAAECRLLTSTR